MILLAVRTVDGEAQDPVMRIGRAACYTGVPEFANGIERGERERIKEDGKISVIGRGRG